MRIYTHQLKKMRKIKLILKKKDRELAEQVKEELEKHKFDVYHASKYGVYLNSSDELLNQYFKCNLKNNLDNITNFKIPENLKDKIKAIYEPNKPLNF